MLSAREKKKILNRKYYAKKRDEILAQQRDYYRDYYERNRDQILSRRKLRSCGLSIPESVSV